MLYDEDDEVSRAEKGIAVALASSPEVRAPELHPKLTAPVSAEALQGARARLRALGEKNVRVRQGQEAARVRALPSYLQEQVLAQVSDDAFVCVRAVQTTQSVERIHLLGGTQAHLVPYHSAYCIELSVTYDSEPSRLDHYSLPRKAEVAVQPYVWAMLSSNFGWLSAMEQEEAQELTNLVNEYKIYERAYKSA